jgi:hypothetical protein
VLKQGSGAFGWKQLPFERGAYYSAFVQPYTLWSPPLTFRGLCAISVGIFTKGIRLLVKSLIVGTLIEFWSRTLVAPFYEPRCPPLASMVFVDIILDFVGPCISKELLV